MKIIKCLVLTVLLLSNAAPVAAEVKGWGLGAGIFDGDFGLQGRKDIWLGGDISQFTAQAAVYFHDTTTFRLDADYHFIINPESPSRFYPLVGLDLAFNKDAVKLGLNLGGGVNFMLTEKLAAFGEIKYVISDWNGLAITVGIYL